LTGGNRNDITQLIPLLQAVPPVRGKRGRPRRRPDLVLGDRGYDHDKYRRLRTRWEIRDDIHEAFLTLGCALICWRRLNSFR
jgi:hypothetical protein